MCYTNREQDTSTFPAYSSILNRRYEYAAGLFFERRDLEKALNDLEINEFPMQQLTVIAENTVDDSYIADIKILNSQSSKITDINIPNHIVNYYYSNQVNSNCYLVILRGTAILLAAAQYILKQHGIQDVLTFHSDVFTSSIKGNEF